MVERNNTKYALIERRESIARNAAQVGDLEKQSVNFITPVDPAPFRAKLGPYYANWAKTFGPKAWAYSSKSIGHKLG